MQKKFLQQSDIYSLMLLWAFYLFISSAICCIHKCFLEKKKKDIKNQHANIIDYQRIQTILSHGKTAAKKSSLHLKSSSAFLNFNLSMFNDRQADSQNFPVRSGISIFLKSRKNALQIKFTSSRHYGHAKAFRGEKLFFWHKQRQKL